MKEVFFKIFLKLKEIYNAVLVSGVKMKELYIQASILRIYCFPKNQKRKPKEEIMYFYPRIPTLH